VSGVIHPDVLLVTAGLAAGYVRAAQRHRARLCSARSATFGLGLAAFVVAFTGPVHDLAETALFTAHMLQHLLLTLVVPPCLLAGTPPAVLDGVLAPLLDGRATGWMLRRLTRPVPALSLYAAALFTWHLPVPFEMALEGRAWHVVEHATLVLTSFLAWWPVVSPASRLPALPYAGRILYLFVYGFPMTIVAAMVTVADHVLYPFYAGAPRPWPITPLDDQRLGGVLMWVPAGLVPLLAFTVVFFRWAAATEAEEADAQGRSFAADLVPSDRIR
jgi:putative membrane protein